MDFDIWYYKHQADIGYSKMKKAFEAGQQSKQAEIDAIKSKLSDIYDASDENEAVAHLLDEIQELLK